MKLSEVKKLCDGTFEKIRENLIDMVKRNKLGTGNKRLKGRYWTNMDVKKSNEMIDVSLYGERIKQTKGSKNDQKPTRNGKDKTKSEE
ncbi:hypothetical protein Tco_0145629 [Tanacetum coccineum]